MENPTLIKSVPKAGKPIVSIIIAVYNNLVYTLQCLESIKLCKENVPFEVIVIDDYSTDELTEKIIPKIKGLRYYRTKRNGGFVKSINIGAKNAKGKYIYLLNNDTRVTDNYLTYLIEIFKKFDNVGVVGSKLIYPDGKLQEAGGHIYTNGKGFNYGKFQDPNDYRFNYVREVDYISGTAILIKKDIWYKLGGFDENFSPGYYEDTDFQFRVRQAGYKIIYQPRSTIIHYEGITFENVSKDKGKNKYLELNRKKFVKKHYKYLQENNFTEDYSQMDYQIFPKNKKHVFVFEDHLPTYDQDSGSLRFSNIVKILQSKYQVTLIPHGSYFHSDKEYKKYYHYYAQQGIRVAANLGQKREINIEQLLMDNKFEVRAVVLFRPEIAIKYINVVRKYLKKTKIIYDPVDLTHLRLETEINYLKASSSSDFDRLDRLNQLAHRHKIVDRYLTNKTDEVWAITQEEKQYIIAKFNVAENKIKLIPNILDIKPTKNPYEKRKDMLFIGGFAHPPNVEAIRFYQEKIVPELEKRNININLIVVGSKTEVLKNLPHRKMKIVGYVDNPYSYFNSCLFAFYPLMTGAGMKGKVTQALGYGLPIITSTIGAQGNGDDGRKIMLIANTPAEFVEKISFIMNNRNAWEEIVRGSRRYFRNNFHFQSVKDKLLKNLND